MTRAAIFKSNRSTRLTMTRFLSATALTAAGVIGLLSPAQANDAAWSDFDDVHGSITIDTNDAAHTKIDQHTQTYIGNSNNLDILTGQTVTIGQNNTGSLFVGRSTRKGVDPTRIMGSLNTRLKDDAGNFTDARGGSVMVLDRNGIIHGANSSIDVGGWHESTGDVSNADILDGDGHYEFSNFGDGAIELNGSISVADAGLASFVSPTIINNGVINAKMGSVVMASGARVTLDLYGDNLVEIAVDEKLSDALIENTGTINAEGGTVIVKADAAKNIVDNVINMAGVVNASSATVKGGKIVLGGGSEGKVTVSGVLAASGTEGGDIEITGQDIEVTKNALLLADGGAGASQLGNGGTIYTYANNDMVFSGRAMARGGYLGGNGGFVEVSATNRVGYDGSVSTKAYNGVSGTFLIDPLFAIIHSGSIHTPLGFDYILSAEALANDLAQNGSLLVQADQYIDVGTDIDLDIPLIGSVENGPINLANYAYSEFPPPPPGCGFICQIGYYLNPANMVHYNGITGGNITLQSDTVNFNKELTIGKGSLTVMADTINLASTIKGYEADNVTVNLLDDSRMDSTASEVNVLSNAALIQQGVDIAATGATVNVAGGTYEEQVEIGKNLSLKGAGLGITTIVAPDALATTFTPAGYPYPIAPVIYGHDATDINISDLTVDGASKGNANNRFAGIGFHNAGGLIDAVSIKNVKNDPFDGVQGGYGIFAYNDGVSTTLNIKNSNIKNFQKNGIMFGGAGLSGTIAGNKVTGRGATGTIAQNGIVILNGAVANVKDNLISDFGYTNDDAAATGVLLSGAGEGTRVHHNTITGTGYDVGIYAASGSNSVDIYNNDITGSADGIDVVGSNDVKISTNTIIDAVYDGIYVSNVDGSEVSGNTIKNSGDDGIEIEDSSGVVSVTGNTVDGTTGGHESNGLAIANTDGVIVSGNTIKNTDWNNINVVGADGTQITGNTLENSRSASGIGIWTGSDNSFIDANTIKDSQYGIWNQGGNLEIARNTITGHAVDGIYLTGTNSANIHNNFIWDNVNAGIRVDGGTNDVTVFDNSFAETDGTQANGKALINNTGNTVNASVNWWGSNVATNVANSVTGSVDISPYQGSGIDQDLLQAGYQGNLGNLYVTTLGAQTSGLIQEAIDAADDNGTVTVNAGDYTENLMIDVEGLKLAGLNGANLSYDEFNSGRGTAGNLITVTADDVNIDPFVFDGGGVANYGINASGADGLIVDGNSFSGFVLSSINVDNSDNVKIFGNTITGGKNGIQFTNVTNSVIGGVNGSFANTIENIDAGWGNSGINIKNGNGLIVENNILNNIGGQGIYAEGFWAMPAASLVIKDNLVQNAEHNAVYLKFWNGAEIAHNRIIGTTYGDGVQLELTTEAQVSNNLIRNVANHGVNMTYGNVDSTISKNTIRVTGADGIHASGNEGLVIADNFIGFLNDKVTPAGAGNIDGDGILVASSTGTRITGNSVTETTGYGIRVNSSNNAVIGTASAAERNTVSAADLDGIKVSGGTGVTVENNDVSDAARVGIYAENAIGLNIKGNVVDNTTFAIGSPYGGITTDWGSDITISGNTVTDSGHGVMMYLTGGTNTISGNHIDTQTDNGVNANQVAGLTVSGNFIGQTGGANNIGGNGIAILNSPSTIVDGNTISNTGDNGIYLNPSPGSTVENNILSMIGENGIYLSAGNNGVTVHNNTLRSIGLNGQYDGIHALSSNDLTITENDILGSVTYAGASRHGIYVSGGTSALIEDNTVRGANATSGANGKAGATTDAIHVTGNSGVEVLGNTIRGGDSYGSLFGTDRNGGIGAGQYGIYVSNSANADVIDNDVIGGSASIFGGSRGNAAGADGIRVASSNGSEVDDNNINNVALNGINILDSNNVDVTNNDLHTIGQHGIYASNTRDLDVLGNTIGNGISYGARLDGIHINGGRNAEINDNTIQGGLLLANGAGNDGIHVDGNREAIITNNTIKGGAAVSHGAGRHAIYANNSGAQGVLSGRNGVRITGNYVTNTGLSLGAVEDGIHVENSAGGLFGDRALIENNTINAVGDDGISVVDTAGARVLTNTVLGAGNNGIDVRNSDAADIMGNTVTGAGNNGIYVNPSSFVEVANNIISGALANGIYMLGGLANSITNNTISLVGEDGIHVEDVLSIAITGNGITGAGDDGIDVVNSGPAEIDNNTVIGALDNGIILNGSALASVNDNIITGVGSDGINISNVLGLEANGNTITGAGDDGIDVAISAPVTINGNTVTGVLDNGIVLNGSAGAQVNGNTVSLAGNDGININGIIGLTVQDNDIILTGGDGIDVRNVAGADIVGNTTTLTGGHGIYVDPSFGVDISGNIVLLAGLDGIHADDIIGLTITDNLVGLTGGDGIDVQTSAGVLIEDNATFLTAGDGIKAGDVLGLGIYGNTVLLAGDDGIDVNNAVLAEIDDNLVVGTSNNGITLTNAAGALITNNTTVLTGADGIHAQNVAGVGITGNTVLLAGDDGIDVDTTALADISNNTVIGATNNGIALTNAAGAQITDNFTMLTGADGIHAQNVLGLGIYDNTVTLAGDDGIDVDTAALAQIDNNRVFGAGNNGIALANSAGALINGNLTVLTGNDGIHTENTLGLGIVGNMVMLAGGDGIDVDNALLTAVAGNTVVGVAGNGIEISDAAGLLLAGNTVAFAGGNGIDLDRTLGSLIVGNDVSFTAGHGINIDESALALVAGNDIAFTLRDGIHMNDTVLAAIGGNTIAYTGGDGIDVEDSDRVAILGNTVDYALGNAVEVSDSNDILIAANDVGLTGFVGQNGIDVRSVNNVTIATNNIGTNVQDDGIYVNPSSNVLISGNIIDGVGLAGIHLNGNKDVNVVGNTVSNSGQHGLYASGQDNGLITLAGNTFINNTVGAEFETGTIDLTGATNTFIGGTTGMIFDPTLGGDPSRLVLVDDTIGTTVFDGLTDPGDNFIILANGAFFDPGTPTILDARFARFNGVSASDDPTFQLTQLQFNEIENRIFHYTDDNSLGLFFFGFAPSNIEQEDLLQYFNPVNLQLASLNITVRGLPQIPGGPQNFNAITPFAGNDPASLNNITPSAGGTDPADLNAIEAAAGGTEATCWGDAAGMAQAGQSVNISYGTGFEDTLSGAASCQSSL